MEVLQQFNVDFTNQKGAWEHTLNAASENNNSDESSVMRSACAALAKRLESELRAAKSAQLACGEVLLPADLLPRVARAVVSMADSEPCGLRGCTLFVNFETEAVCRRLCTIKCDPGTVSTFELFLTLKQDATSWHNLLPQFLKNLTRGGTVMISPAFTLSKKKLYRSYQQFSSTD